MKKKDKINILILIAIFLIILFSVVGISNLNGSIVDWNSQHTVFPDYFRKLFYETKNLFPSFAFNIGAGENIYNYSYYGLLNPLILISYLLPFIKMVDYIIVMMICVIISSIIICYKWLRQRFDSDYSFLGTLLFLLSGPIIYHTHRHIMFIDYMPFLLLALIGVDQYFKNNKKILLSSMVFLIIMTSYYYSIVSIICIILYGIYVYLEINTKMTFKTFIKDGLKFIYPIMIGIISSSIILLPTAYTILSGRSDITNSSNILSTLIPTINIDQILYNSYTIGLSSILILSIIYGILSKNKGLKLISIVLALFIIFPIFIYILNAGMYVRGKVLIPLLPICIFLITYTLKNISTKENKKFIITITIISILEIIINICNNHIYLALDVILLLISYFIYNKTNSKKIIIYPLIFTSFIICITNNISEKFVSKQDSLKQYDDSEYTTVEKLSIDDDNLYRTGTDLYGKSNANYVYSTNIYLSSVYSSLINKYYTNFTNELIGNEMQDEISTALFPTKNILFNNYMGLKYLISDSASKGYTKISDNLYVNDNVLPIGYATNKIIGNEYNSLSYPDNIYALYSNIVVNKDLDTNYESKITKESINYEILEQDVEINNNEIISSKDNSKLILKLDKDYSNKILFIRFKMNYAEKCSIGNTSITINNITNMLSCRTWTYPNKNNIFDYILSDVTDTLTIEFSKGKYLLSDLEIYSVDYNDIMSFNDQIDEFIIDKDKTSGDYIEGNIDVTNDGYFILTIPYDKGFSIYVDGIYTDYEKVDTSFIGFEIEKGSHNIQITYSSPLKKEGMILSIIGLTFMILIDLRGKHDKQNKTNI